MYSGLPHVQSEQVVQDAQSVEQVPQAVAQAGQLGSPRKRSAVPMLPVVVVKRRISTPLVASAQPSVTSPGSTVVFHWMKTSLMAALRSASPPAGGTHVHCAVHCWVLQFAASLPSH